MTPLQIILIIIIIPITILNIRGITTGQRTKKVVQYKYRCLIAVLQNNEDKLGGSGAYTAAKYVSDAGNNFLVCKTEKGDKKAIVTEKSFYLFNDVENAKCELEIVKDKKLRSIVCKITSSEWEDIYIPLAENAHSFNWIIKKLIEIAEDFRDEFNS